MDQGLCGIDIRGSISAMIRLFTAFAFAVLFLSPALVQGQSDLDRLEEREARKRGKELHLVKEDLSAFGDEGYVSAHRGSEAVAFRKGKFIVNVAVVAPENNNDLFFSRKFAEHVAKVLELQ